MELAAWREREAQSRDVPRSARAEGRRHHRHRAAAPRTPEALGHLRSIPSGFERSRSGRRHHRRRRARAGARPEVAARHGPPPRAAERRQRHGRASEGALEMVSEQQGVAAKMIATVDDLEPIAADDEADVPALRGWRREFFGETAWRSSTAGWRWRSRTASHRRCRGRATGHPRRAEGAGKGSRSWVSILHQL